MNAKQLSRELRRIARREVPNGEPDLWPAIRREAAPRRTPYSSPGTYGASIRSESSNGGTELSSIYVWTTDSRRGRLGNGARLLAAGAALVLLAAVLAVVMENRGSGDNRSIGAIETATPSQASSRATPATTFGISTSQPLAWPSTGKLDVPITPAPGSNISGSVNAQILPTGDLRMTFSAYRPGEIVTWHVVPESCAALANTPEPDLNGTEVIPAFLEPGGSPEFIPADRTHQPLTVVAFEKGVVSPTACASIPAVPASLVVAYDPAPGVPRTCPVTLPSRPLFAPGGQSIDPSQPMYGDYWYGTNDLWTGLPLDGDWSTAMKVFWWSTGYSANAEPVPALTVTGKRLDGDAAPATVDVATNADGAMLAGVTFPTSGCWQISGTYRDHALSFVVWVNANAGNQVTQAPGPVPVVTGAPGADGVTHTDLACRASSFGPSTATPSDINIEVGGTATSGQFWALLFQPMPIYAQRNVQIAWKIGSTEPITMTVEDASGLRIDPASGPRPNTSANWPRPGSEWLTSIVFPYSGCWHVQAHAGAVTGDMWFEVFSQPVTPVPAATSTLSPTSTSASVCSNVSNLQPSADFGDGYGPAHMGPLWLSAFGSARTGKAVITGFVPGYPTKVVMHPDPGLQGVVDVRGSDCDTGQPLRFCYGSGTCGFNGTPVSEADLSQRGDTVVTVQGHLDLTGYILFPKAGSYRLWVEQDGEEVGSVVVQVESP